MRTGMALLALAALSVAAAPAVALQDAPAPAQDGKASFRLGVVNLKTIFETEKYERMKDVNADLKKRHDEIQKQVRDQENKITQFKDQLSALDKSQMLYGEKLLALKRAETELKFIKEYNAARQRDHFNDIQIQIYNDIRKAVKAIGIEQKYDLILHVEEPQLEEDDPYSSRRILGRVVLFHQDSVDVTEKVIERLNADWLKVKAAKGPAEWECPGCKQKIKEDKCAKCGKQRP